jgi:hypothetical protein
MIALANDNPSLLRDEVHEIILELIFSCQSPLPLGTVSTLVDTAVDRVMKVTGE